MKSDFAAFLGGCLLGLVVLGVFAAGWTISAPPKPTPTFCLTTDDAQAEVKADEVEVTSMGCIVFKQDGKVKSGFCSPMTPFVFRRGECK